MALAGALATGSMAAAPAQEAVVVRVRMGQRDEKAQVWKGQFELRHATLQKAEPYTDLDGQVVSGDGTFLLQSQDVRLAEYHTMMETGLLLTVIPEEGAELVLRMEGKERAYPLSDLSTSASQGFLKGRVQVDRQPLVEEFSGDAVDWDFPALCRTEDDTLWLAWVEHVTRGRRIIDSFFAPPADYASYRPAGGGDRLLLRARVDGEWQEPVPLTDVGEDLGPPAMVATAEGPLVVWSAQVHGRWNLRGRLHGIDGAPAREWDLTDTDGLDRAPALVRSSTGRVWVAWQSYRQGRLVIVLGRVGAEGIEEVAEFGDVHANSWSPALAADSQGQVHLAYDSYEYGDFDVAVATFRDEDEAELVRHQWVARSTHFEARPGLACDAQDRLWVAWEERGVDWGKDDFGVMREEPGASLYRQGSLVRVCVLDGEEFLTPTPAAASLEDHGRDGGELRTHNSHARLMADGAGGMWLGWRKRTRRLGQVGTMYESFLQRYAGDAWGAAWILPESDHTTARVPAMVTSGDRAWLAWSGDQRRRCTADWGAATSGVRVLEEALTPVEALALVPAEAPRERSHRNRREATQVQRLRDYRLDLDGRTYQVLRGDFHRHTDLSPDGGLDGTVEDAWRYALDAADLDWGGITDHDSGWWEYPWWLTQKSTDQMFLAGRFVSLFGYERSTSAPLGHRNVLFPTRGVRPLPRLLKALDATATVYSGDDTGMLYAYLREMGGLCIPHTTATRTMGLEWRIQDRRVEPLVEIYQGSRQSYEAPGAPRAIQGDTDPGGGVLAGGFVSEALAKEFRYGFVAWSDHNSTHVSYTMVLVEEATREGLVEALQARHCHGATDNILVVVRAGDHLMGDAFTTDQAPVLDVEILGAAAVRNVHILKNGAIVHTEKPGTIDVRFQWQDPDSQPGTTSYYYVRVEQGDEELAWSSPLWITRDP